MAEVAVTLLQEQVTEVMTGYADLISGAGKEFEQLNDALDSLKSRLKEKAEKMKNDNLLRELERSIRDAVYEVEDAIDTCLTKAIESNAKKSIRRRLGIKSFSLAKEVKSLHEDKVRPLFDIISNFGDDGSGGGEEPSKEIGDDGSGGGEEPSEKHKPASSLNTVEGLEDAEKTITGYLMQETERLDVIPIIGMPGQGKTTLARKIYENENINHHFPILIWTHISQSFDSRDVFLQILGNFSPSQDTSNLPLSELAETVHECLEKEKFLLVLDDIWSVDAWEKIKPALPLDNGKGKVLITSCHMDVGISSRVYREPHQLQVLTELENWKLLQYEVFGNLKACPPELRGVGKLIADKCHGLPLATAVIGAILKDQLTGLSSTSMAEKEWRSTMQNMSTALQHGEAQQPITSVVGLSYNRLPNDLKDCFLYVGVFPDDYEIPVKMLYGLWNAEGFIQPKDGRSMEESAEKNLNDLIRMNLLKVQKTNHLGKAKTCRVHHMIRAFCIDKSEKENLFQEIRGSKTVSGLETSRRLCFRSDLPMFLSKSPCCPHVRSFLCFNERPLELDPEYIDGFRKLRILESKCIRFHQFPAKVTKLIHLRYLTLYIETIEILPEPITQLWNLQSLVVETKSRSITMKANMWRMVRLRHLKTRAAIILDSKWEGEAGQNLHTLSRLAPESCTVAVAEKAKNLRTLGISGKLSNIFESKFLENMHHLEKLKLVNSSTYEPTSEGMLRGPPQRNRFPPNLKSLTLTNTFVGWQQMSALANIDTLEVLKLKDNAFIGTYWEATDSFPRLQLLLIWNADLVIWEASSQSFPSLKCLVLKNCENLNEIPVALTETLENLEIEHLPESAVVSAREIFERKTRAKVQEHVPFKFSSGPGCYR